MKNSNPSACSAQAQRRFDGQAINERAGTDLDTLVFVDHFFLLFSFQMDELRSTALKSLINRLKGDQQGSANLGPSKSGLTSRPALCQSGLLAVVELPNQSPFVHLSNESNPYFDTI